MDLTPDPLPAIAEELDRRLHHLHLQLDHFAQGSTTATERDELALDILCDRDTLQSLLKELAKNQQLEAAAVAQVDALDRRLAQLDSQFLSISALPRWRATFDPSPSAWWWFPETEAAKPQLAVRKRELFWRGVSVISLLATASAASTMLPVFSIGGFGFGEALASAGQVTGLAVLGRGVLTPEGTKVLKRFCARFSIPGNWYSEAIAALSITLGLTSWWLAQDGLPKWFNHRAGIQYEQGNLRAAQDSYKQTLTLDSSNEQAILGLGLVFESLDQLKQAGETYRQAADQGNPIALSRLARVQFEQLLKTARPEKLTRNAQTAEVEGLLKMALHRLPKRQLPPVELANQTYQIYRNLGWLRWWQRDYTGAEGILRLAIAEDASFPQEQLGTGLSHCLLAQIQRERGLEAAAQELYRICLQKARPETLPEYQWFFQVGQGRMATCIDTSAVMQGTDRTAIAQLPLCQRVEVDRATPVAPDPTP